MISDILDLLKDETFKINSNKERNKLRKIIDNIIDLEGWDNSIKEIIKVCIKEKLSKDTVQIIISFWQDFGDLDIIFLILTKYYLIPRNELDYLFENLELSDLKVMIKKSIELIENQNYSVLANNLISFYDEDLRGDDYIELIEYTRVFQEKTQVDCKSIIAYFIYKKSYYVYAKIPDWVNIEEGENLSLLKTLNPGKSYEDVEDYLEKIVTKAKDFFYITPDILENKKISLENDEVEEISVKPELDYALLKFLTASSLEESSEIDHKANRIFGPVNRCNTRNCISNPGKDGPCRMLECLCLEDDSSDWFHGNCDNYYCSKKIRDRSHAVRIPENNGGWKGGFCNFECLEDSLLFKDKDTAYRLETLKNTINEDGIMDRTKT